MNSNKTKKPCVYIAASKGRGVVYIGVTSNLSERIWKHKHGVTEGIVKKYNVNQLVHYELFETMEEAASRELQLRHWEWAWKNELVTSSNPYWKDLSHELW
ncbi:GIY-YIG nuclease family protein [Vibrio chaetopteri]|uniref:GIY-YIG nuclease family protein n=1 Tax=Vibrio chaetopteri TaxID=3016528 RepID=UPI003AB3EB16